MTNYVEIEKEKVLNNKMNRVPVLGLRITRLCKTYNYYPFGIKSEKDLQALRDVYLEVDDGELIAILGHNGAGKSTLINVLTGITTQTEGSAEILDFNIKQDMEEIR